MLDFDATKTTKTRDGGSLLVAGEGAYRPSHEVRAFPVRFECVVDIASKQVREVHYDAIDEDGHPIEKRPTALVRDARYVEACHSELDSRIHGDAVMGRTKCEAYKNWIYSLSRITVWGGCRAEFEFDAR